MYKLFLLIFKYNTYVLLTEKKIKTKKKVVAIFFSSSVEVVRQKMEIMIKNDQFCSVQILQK